MAPARRQPHGRGSLDPKQKKTTTGRDLSDLKARLGLAKGDAAPAAPTAPAAHAGPAPQGMPGAPAPVMPPPGVVPPPGVGMPQAAPQAYYQPQPPPDARRDPFAVSQGGAAAMPQMGMRPIVDAGPPIEIPVERKKYGKLVFALAAVATLPLLVGWWCGRIYGARLVFNKTIDDAKQIRDATTKLAGISKKVQDALAASRARNQSRVAFDAKLQQELTDVLKASPQASLQEAKSLQDQLFRTNYARMEDILISRLFAYYNNMLKLLATTQEFIDVAERNKETVEQYVKDTSGGAAQRNYGIVFASDEGAYYLGQIVEVGPPSCPEKGKKCKASEVKGFPVRVGNSRSWDDRPGKSKKMTDIVVPIVPDENWRQVAAGKPGYLAFKEYVMHLGNVSRTAAALAKDEKELLQDLSKQANRAKLFAPL
ncbi:MAG: hypothetical protein IT371_02765 [Deltaproteobacteria bacterium]|nr:hypothetical protein [Deltaproteobacteria bacterium]